MKTHPFTKKYHDQKKMSIHAEADMVMQLIKADMLDKITDIVMIRGSNTLLSSRPCDLCMRLLNDYLEAARIWWFNEDKNKWIVELV